MPIFDALADPALVARLSAGQRKPDGTESSSGITSAGGSRFSRSPMPGSRSRRSPPPQAIRLGPMVTPLARRRPVKVARETATLDRLSGGRLTLGVGLGSDRSGNELSITGEELDDRRRAGMLDEALEILTAAWSGEAVYHRGEHYTVDGMRFLPRPVQRPGVPVWVGRYPGKRKPLRRAVRFRGVLRSTSSTRTSSPRSSLSSPRSARRSGGTSRSPSTSLRRCRWAPIRRPTHRQVRRGGWWSFRGMGCRWTRYAV